MRTGMVAAAALHLASPDMLRAQTACTTLPAPASTRSVAVSLGVQPVDRQNDPLLRLSSEQRRALVTLATRLRDRIGPLPAAPPPGIGSRFVAFDSLQPLLIPDVSSELTVSIGGTGITGISLSRASALPGLDSTMMAALRDVSASDELESVVAAIGGAPARLVVFTTTHRTPPRPVDPWVQVAMGAQELGVHDGTLAQLRPKQRLPSPTELRSRVGDRGAVLVQHVVAADGRAAARSVRVVQASHDDLARIFREWIPGMAFVPATIGGCPVASLVRQSAGLTTHR